MMYKRLLLTTALLNTPYAQAREWSFDVWLDQQRIGTHTFKLDQQQLKSRASFNVKVLFINAYRYQHQADESWNGDCLAQLTAHTEENKEVTDVQGQLEDGQWRITKNGKQQRLPACVMTFAYWNPAILQQSRLLNPQNAEYLDVTVSDQGMKTLAVKGQPMEAHQYNLIGKFEGKTKLNITLWYDRQNQWVGLESLTPEGYKISYKLN